MPWFAPRTLDEALHILDAEHPTIVGGGTDLFVNWPARKSSLASRSWLDVRHLAALQQVAPQGETLAIGAAVTASRLRAEACCSGLAALREAAQVVGGWQIQNRATVAGNMANASPAADMVIALLALDASVEIQRRGQTCVAPLGEFILGPRKTTLQPDELITAVRIPARNLGAIQTFLRFDQRSGSDISLVSAAVVLRMEEGRVAEAKIAVGAAHPVPLLLPDADAALLGVPTQGDVHDVAQAYARQCSPITDVRATAEYRRALVAVLVERAVLRLYPAA